MLLSQPLLSAGTRPACTSLELPEEADPPTRYGACAWLPYKSNLRKLIAVCWITWVCGFVGTGQALASVSLTPANATISADNAANALSPAWTTLGTITLTEGANSDFAKGTNVTLILRVPGGYQFNTAVTPSVVYTAGLDFSSASAVMTDSSNITITLTVTNTAARDTLTIGSTTGIQIQPIGGSPLTNGNITVATTSTETVTGITRGSTSLGALTEVGGTVVQLAFTRQPAGATAGAAFGTQPVLKSEDQFGNPSTNGLLATSYIALALNAGTGPLQGTTSTNLGMSGAKGAVTFTNLRLDVAGANDQLSVTSTNGLTTALSGLFTVSPAAASKLVIATQPSSTATAGVAFLQQPVIYVKDAYNNLCNTNSTVVATRNAGAGTLLGSTSVAAVGGVATYTNLAHAYATNVTIQFAGTGLTSTNSAAIAVSPNTYSQLLVLAPGQTNAPGTANGIGGTAATQTAGTAFAVKVLASDAYGNLVVNVADTIGITSSDTTAALPDSAALVNGTNSFTLMLNVPGSQTVTASDLTTGSQTKTSSAITVKAGTFTKLQLLQPGESAAPGTTTGKIGAPTPQVAGTPFSVTVNAVDANWNRINTNDTIKITSSDPSAGLPANAALAAGTKNFTITLQSSGAITITASNVTHTGIAPCTSPPITVYYLTSALQGQPVVAIHDSELTRALETMPASGATPTGPGTTTNQWWPTNWHYFVMPESVKETLRSDGTAFELAGDTDIRAGRLLAANGQPQCPILISLAAEAISDDEIAALTNYVAAGGTLLVGSSAFTRNPDGTTRGDFALASQMGLHMLSANLQNWATNFTFTKGLDHSLVSHIPAGTLTWQMPSSADEIPWGTSPTHTLATGHALWRTQVGDASVIATGDNGLPCLALKSYGKGTFIYCAAMQPLIGHGGWAPGMYAYGILRNAIQLAFASSRMALPKLSPWPFAYDAALNVRHDLEDYQSLITNIQSSASYEATNGVKGDYYFCTGTLRVELTNSATVIAGLRRAVSNYGATIGSHNGGLKNPNNPSLVLSDYDYWHWGPDEALDVTPAGYASGKAYAFTSISNSFKDIEGWLPGLTNGIRSWVGCYFNSVREDSYDVLEQLKVRTAGDQKLSPFPHWTVSTRTSGKRYSAVSVPVSDWYVGTQIAQSTEAGHTTNSIRAAVDYYYNLGALVNIYSHSLSDGTGQAGGLVQDYIGYSTAKPRIWSTNVFGLYTWWLARSNAQITASSSTNGNQAVTTFSIKGAADSRTAVEILIPQPSYYGVQVLTNGVAASANSFRINGQAVKLLVGTSVTNAVIRYTVTPVAVSDLYYSTQDTALTVPAPGVLSNDVAGSSGAMSAALVSSPAHGMLGLNADGSFTYIPSTNFSGVDSFTYRASDGVTNSSAVTVTLCVAPTGALFADDFTRSASSDPLAPWQVASGTWSITNGVLDGASVPQTYGLAYLANNWASYWIQARLQFPAGAFGGGLGGRLNPATGAHYAAWIYPEVSPGGAATLGLVKFQNWTSFGYNGVGSVPMSQVSLPSVGTNWHSLKLSFLHNSIGVYYDGSLVMSVIDTEAQPYVSGGISLEMWTSATPYVMAADDLLVGPNAVGQTITFGALPDKSYGDPPFTVSATASSGLPVSFSILSGPATIASNTITLTGTGTVTVRATQPGDLSYAPAAPVDQSFTVVPAPDGQVFGDTFARPLNPGSLSPWVAQQGLWAVTNDVLQGSSPAGGYGYAYLDGAWTNYSVEGQVRLSSTGGWGEGIGGRLNPITGAHYGAWLYPAGSPGGSNVLRLIKFLGWTSWSGTPMAEIAIPDVGTNWHTLKLEFLTNQIAIYLDGVQDINTTDNNFDGQPAYSSGGITADMYVSPDTPYTMSLDNVVVKVLRPLLAVTANNASRPYGTPNPGFTGNITGLQPGDNISATYSAAADTNSPIGLYAIVPTLDDPDHKLVNYNLAITNGTLTVTQAVLTVTADAKTKVYGSPNPLFTASYSGFVNGESSGVLSGSPGLTTLATQTSPVGNYTITAGPGSLSAFNYTFTFVDGDLVITQSQVTVSGITADNKVYDGTNTAAIHTDGAVLYGALSGDDLTLNTAGAIGAFDDAAVGTGKTVHISGLTLNGSSATNYTILQPTVTADITLRPITVTADAKGKVPGQADPALTYQITSGSLMNGDSLTGSLTRVPGEDLGDYPILQGTLAADGNYELTYVPAYLTIHLPILTVTGITADSKLYDGTTNATLILTNAVLVGVANGEDVTLDTTNAFGAFTDPTVGTGKVVTVTGLALLGADAGKYILTQPTTNADITPVTLTPSVTVASKLYDGTTAASITGRSLSGIVGSDDVSLDSSGTAAFADKNVGVSKTVSVTSLSLSGSSATNYVLSATTTTASADITLLPITITADPKSKAFGDPDPAFTYHVTSGSLVSGDVLFGSLARAPGENVGTYAILQDNLSAGNNYQITFVSANLTIARANSTLAIVSSLNPAAPGATVTITADLYPTAPNGQRPTGSVQFFLNGVIFGSPIPITSGGAGFSTTDLPAGNNVILATYAGDSNCAGSANSLVQVVDPAAIRPSALGITVSKTGTVTVNFSGAPGSNYVVQARGGIAPSVWQNVSTNTADAQGRWTFTETPGGLQPRYYRAATP